MSPSLSSGLALLVVAASLPVSWFLFNRWKRAPCPPGPTGYPIIGNYFDMPSTQPWMTYSEWGFKYGALTYLKVFRQPIVIVNTVQAAKDLLEERSSKYSERVSLRMAGEMVGWNNTVLMQPYGPRLRSHRKHFSRVFGQRSRLETHYPLFERASHKQLKRFLEKPDNYADIIRVTEGAIILEIAYGYKAQDDEDPLVKHVNKTMEQFSELFETRTYLVDYISLLKYIPEWFPGAEFQRIAREYRDTLMSMVEEPMKLVKQRITDNSAHTGFVANELRAGSVTNEQQEHELKWSAASMYTGGADTTVCAMHTFMLTMTLFPEAQRKAQEEIDSVIGHDRLPTHADRANLPYVGALHTEVLRWSPVGPLGIPRRSAEDDEYEGYSIPKDSVIYVNVWHMLHDPTVYPDPLAFKPERFLKAPDHPIEQDPRAVAFGFGRRKCPGLNLADATTWLQVAQILATMSISKALDENGQEITPPGKYRDGAISFPEEFKCSIKPRSAHAEALVHAAE